MMAHHQRPAITRQDEPQDHRRVRRVQVQEVGLGVPDQTRQVRAEVELRKTSSAADADDFHRSIPLDPIRPAPLVVHADHSHRAAQPGLRVRQRPDRPLDAAVGRVVEFAEMGDP